MDHRLSEQELFFYEDRICGEAEGVYRLCYGLTLAPDKAAVLLQIVYRQAALQVATLMSMPSDVLRDALYRLAFEHAEESSGKSPASSPLQRLLAQLDRPQKMITLLHFAFDYDEASVAELLDLEKEKVALAIEKAKTMIAKEFDSVDAQGSGQLQLALHSFYLSEHQKSSLQDIVEDSEVRKTRELKRIEEFERFSAYTRWKRRGIFSLFFVLFVAGLIYYMMPNTYDRFKPLDVIAYEAMAFEEALGERLDFPSKDLAEIQQFAGTGFLGFDAEIPSQNPRGWQPVGASIIDYDPPKVVLIEFYNEDLRERLYFFEFPGHLQQLPYVQKARFENIEYVTFDNANHNLIFWEMDRGKMAALVGRRGGRELASIANQLFLPQ
jgi:hypothetical protein